MAKEERVLLRTKLGAAKSIEEAKAILKEIAEIRIEAMHLLPQAKEFAPEFKRAGLTVDEYVIYVDKALHRLKRGPGLHTVDGGNWNKVWRKFFDAHKLTPATRQQILDQLEQMLRDFKLVE